MLNRIFLFASLIAAIIIVSMLFFTTPATLGPLGILVFFIMLYVLMLGVSMMLVQIFKKFVQRKKQMMWKDYADGAVIAFWPVMVLVFISVGMPNLFVAIIGSTLFVALCIFIIKKV